MKSFVTEKWGPFSCALIENPDPTTKNAKTLSFRGDVSHLHLAVPRALCAEAGRLLRRNNGEAILDFAETLIDIETGLKAAPRKPMRRKHPKKKGNNKTIKTAFRTDEHV